MTNVASHTALGKIPNTGQRGLKRVLKKSLFEGVRLQPLREYFRFNKTFSVPRKARSIAFSAPSLGAAFYSMRQRT
jgi:hypothetical protein